jgi:tRNA A37 threonylcarbamoyladenosine synthetase subunit TsaC/SUA5/YrdC
MGILQPQTNKGAKTLRKGGVIAFLTDTVYGQGTILLHGIDKPSNQHLEEK